MMIKTIGNEGQQTCVVITKNGKVVMNVTANRGSTGYVDTDRCDNVSSYYDDSRDMMIVRIEV